MHILEISLWLIHTSLGTQQTAEDSLLLVIAILISGGS
jgi:hypothetical protein